MLIALRPELSENLKYYRKQTTQLYSKMRYIAAQFIPYLKEDIWMENARESNRAARRLFEGMETVPGVKITQAVQSNAHFFTAHEGMLVQLGQRYFF